MLEQTTRLVEAAQLYEQDFYLWTQQLVATLKAGRWEALDIDNLIEEIESLGKSDRRVLKHRLEIFDSPSLNPYLQSVFTASYQNARELAASETSLDLSQWPETCPWALPAILDKDYWPK